MGKVTFVTADGSHTVVETEASTLMEAALDHDIPGIVASCGGVCSCATCHVRVDPSWAERVGAANELEQDTLEFVDGVTPESRLSCQVELREELDGLIVHVPEEA